MKNKIWFKAKQYGWGWYPNTWQGWLITLGFIAIISFNAYRIDSGSNSVGGILTNFIPQTFILTLILIGICYLKGEKPRWRWG